MGYWDFSSGRPIPPSSRKLKRNQPLNSRSQFFRTPIPRRTSLPPGVFYYQALTLTLGMEKATKAADLYAGGCPSFVASRAPLVIARQAH